MRRAGAPRSPVKTAVLTITVLGLLYWWFGSSSAASVNQATPTPQARWTPRGKGAGAGGEVHGDARDLGFKKAEERAGPPPPQRVRVAPPDAPPARQPVPPPAPIQKRPPVPKERDDYDQPVVRKQRLDVAEGDAAFVRGAKAVDRRVGAREDEGAPPLRDDDDLDGAQNKKKGKLGKGKKKLPLGGGWKPVEPAPVAAPADKKAQDKWGNSGWQARFKQKGGAGAAGAGVKGAGEDEATESVFRCCRSLCSMLTSIPCAV